MKRIDERHRLDAESLALHQQNQLESTSPPSSPKRISTPQSFLDRTSRLALPSDRDRPELLGPTRDLLVSGSGKVVGAVKKPLKGLGSLVFGEAGGGESPPDRVGETTNSRQQPPTGVGGQEEQAREREEEAAVRLANAEIERAERAELEQRGQTLEMLTQMFPGIHPSHLPPFAILQRLICEIWIEKLLKRWWLRKKDAWELVLIFVWKCLVG